MIAPLSVLDSWHKYATTGAISFGSVMKAFSVNSASMNQNLLFIILSSLYKISGNTSWVRRDAAVGTMQLQ